VKFRHRAKIVTVVCWLLMATDTSYCILMFAREQFVDFALMLNLRFSLVENSNGCHASNLLHRAVTRHSLLDFNSSNEIHIFFDLPKENCLLQIVCLCPSLFLPSFPRATKLYKLLLGFVFSTVYFCDVSVQVCFTFVTGFLYGQFDQLKKTFSKSIGDKGSSVQTSPSFVAVTRPSAA